MHVSKIKEIEPLIQRRKKILETIDKLDRVKEFTTVSLEGEDGGERMSTIKFSWQEQSNIPGMVRDYMRKIVCKELQEIESEIEKI